MVVVNAIPMGGSAGGVKIKEPARKILCRLSGVKVRN